MGSFDSSPNYKRATSRFDGKKENSPEGSECDDIISVTCSTCESSINSPYAQKHNNGIKQSSSKKTLKNFGKARSFRRRLKPRIVQYPIPVSDEDSLVESSHSSSPHYLQPTTSSQGKKTRSQTSPRHSESPSSDRSCSHPKSFQTLSRTPSFRILIKKASFRPKKPALNYPKVAAVDRATYSSTVKDSKFPEPVELESETSSGVKVCRYHHCSLHGCRGGHDPDPPLKRFLYKKRRSLKKQKSIVPRTESRRGVNSKSQTVPIVEPLNQERIISNNVVNSQEDNFYNQDSQPFVDGYKDIEEAILVEIAFGETSFPERSYRENLDILNKYSSTNQDFGGQSSCSCHNREEVASTLSRAKAEVSTDGFSNEISLTGSTDVSVTSSLSFSKNPNEASGLNWPETTVESDEVAEKKSAFSSASYSQTSSDGNSEEEVESSRNESTTTGDSKVDEVSKVEDSEVNSPVLTGSTLQFSKPRHISMWHMIHQHMSSNLSVEPTNGADGPNSPLATTSRKDSPDSDNDSETREIEIRKMFAIKLVREAIEKILLPEVQDQTSDDQSVASESTPRPEIVEKNQSKETNAEVGEANSSSDPKDESATTTDDASSGKMIETEKEAVTKTEKKAPKHWSNLKKWILLQRFIRELEKVRKFNPRKPRHLPVNPDPETEKVNLRPQTLDGRKSAEEWMLDYALRQAVSQLAPTQKRKVSLLVKAFETVVPQQDDSQVQIRTPRPRFPILASKDQETRIKTTNEVCHQDKQADCIEGKTNDSSQTGHKNHIEMWHMIYHHVVSDIAEKVGRQLLDGSEDDEAEQNGDSDDFSNNLRSGLTKSNALKLVKEAVDEILVPEIQDDSSGTQSVTSEGGNLTSKEGEDRKGESQVIKNWSKLKNVIMLKRSIRALEKARISKAQPTQPPVPQAEPEKVDLRRQMMDERKKAEQWMLDYAVQHIVTKLTPARKRRVSMLVEAFEAVVPIPEG